MANCIQARTIHKEGDEILATTDGKQLETLYIAEVLEGGKYKLRLGTKGSEVLEKG